MYYDVFDFVTNRTSSDVENIKRIKAEIREVGWDSLSAEDKLVYMHTDSKNRIIGARGCLNISDLNRYAWMCAYQGHCMSSYRSTLNTLMQRKGLNYQDFFPTVTVNATSLYTSASQPISFTWVLGQDIPYRYTDGAYDVQRLSEDIKSIFKFVGETCHNMNTNMTVFDGITIEELNKIDYVLLNVESKIINKATNIEVALTGEEYA